MLIPRTSFHFRNIIVQGRPRQEHRSRLNRPKNPASFESVSLYFPSPMAELSRAQNHLFVGCGIRESRVYRISYLRAIGRRVCGQPEAEGPK
jgi:hypothetical protein